MRSLNWRTLWAKSLSLLWLRPQIRHNFRDRSEVGGVPTPIVSLSYLHPRNIDDWHHHGRSN